MLPGEEDQKMMETLARERFDMSLDEFTEAWTAGRSDDNRESHADLVGLAMLLPEYLEERYTADELMKPYRVSRRPQETCTLLSNSIE